MGLATAVEDHERDDRDRAEDKGLPVPIRFGKAEGSLTDWLRVEGVELPVVDGELYLEISPGHLYISGSNQKNNRKCEILLTMSSFIAALPDGIDGFEYWREIMTTGRSF